MAELPPLRRPATPKTRTALEQLVGRYSKHYAIPQERIRNWISFMILAGALERVQDAAGNPAFVIKGGVALELRLRLRARATKDFDATFHERFGDMLTTLDRALEEPYGAFHLARRGEIRDIGTLAKRIEIRVQYRNRPWATVQMEVSASRGDHTIEAEQIPATSLEELGLDGPAFVTCLSLRYQIAQKIHAVTAPPPLGRTNDRFRDLADLWLLREIGADLTRLHEACEEVFAQREMHAWPPEVVVPDHWAEPFARLAGELGIVAGVDEAASVLRSYIAEIAQASASTHLATRDTVSY
jgi:hypothetical protein